ncbi:MAG: DoxX family protein [Planctomycetaceae bacterium]
MQQFTTAVQGFTSLVCRLALAAVFLASVVSMLPPRFSATVEVMKSQGVPNPTFALFGAIGLLVIGGVAVVLGAWTRFGAIFLFVFLAAATFYFHDFWTFADPKIRQDQTIQFMKNLAIGGGLLALVAFGGGPWSVDGWIALKQEEAESAAPARSSRSTTKVQQAA